MSALQMRSKSLLSFLLQGAKDAGDLLDGVIVDNRAVSGWELSRVVGQEMKNGNS